MRRKRRGREGVHNLRKTTHPPSSDGWLRAIKYFCYLFAKRKFLLRSAAAVLSRYVL